MTPELTNVDILHVSDQAWSFYWPPTHLLSTQLLNAPFCTMGSNTFLIFLQIIFDEIFNYGPFPIGIMNWIFRSVMIKNNPSKNNSFNCCAFSYFYKYTWPLIDHIFIWFFKRFWCWDLVRISQETVTLKRNKTKSRESREGVSFLERLLLADQLPVSWFFFWFFPEFRRKMLGPLLSVDLRCFWSFIVGALLQKVSFLYPLVQIDTK